MSCIQCNTKFGFFRKEVGCPNCRFTVCSKCLAHKVSIEGIPKKVCATCFARLSNETGAATSAIRPPDRFIKRLEEAQLKELAKQSPQLREMPQAPITVDPDSQIQMRLAALRQDKDKTEIPGDDSIAERLARLRGVPYKDYSNAVPLSLNTDNRSDQEKSDDLLQQYIEETGIASDKSDPFAEIEARLSKLRGEAPQKAEGRGDQGDSSEDEEVAAKNIAKRFLEEAALADPVLDSNEQELCDSLPPPSADTEELPWCTICNEDAVVRCMNCDGELFCRGCFKECHDDEEYRGHQTRPYKKPSNTKYDC